MKYLQELSKRGDQNGVKVSVQIDDSSDIYVGFIPMEDEAIKELANEIYLMDSMIKRFLEAEDPGASKIPAAFMKIIDDVALEPDSDGDIPTTKEEMQ